MAYDEDTPSRRELAIRAFVSLLEESGGPTDLLVHRFRGVPITKDQCPATLVYPISDPGEVDEHGVTYGRALLIRVEHRVKGAGVSVDATSPDELLDPLLCWAVYQVLADRRLGGLCTDINLVGTQWDSLEVDEHYGAAAQDFEILYEHDEGNLTTLDGS